VNLYVEESLCYCSFELYFNPETTIFNVHYEWWRLTSSGLYFSECFNYWYDVIVTRWALQISKAWLMNSQFKKLTVHNNNNNKYVTKCKPTCVAFCTFAYVQSVFL